jgi:hypothetical protein
MDIIGKVCTICKQFKTVDKYSPHKKGKLGVNTSCKECQNKKMKELRKNNLEKFIQKSRDSHKRHREKERLAAYEWAKANKERKRISDKIRNSKPETKAKKNERRRERLKTDINYKLKQRYRTRIYQALKVKRAYKESTSLEYMGCTVGELKIHLEKQFNQFMNWENYGSYWEVDHILPCASFNLAIEEQIKECFHYTNLQPLHYSINRSKGCKLDFLINH